MLSLVNGAGVSRRVQIIILGVVLGVFLLSNVCYANQSMPWDDPLSKIQGSLSGPAAKWVSLIVIGLCGFTIALGDVSGMTKKLLWVVIGIAIVINAADVLSTLFGSASGLGF